MTETFSPQDLDAPSVGISLRSNGFEFRNPDITKLRQGNFTISWDADNVMNERLEFTVRSSFTDLQIDKTGPSPLDIQVQDWDIPDGLLVFVTMPDETGGYLEEDAVRFDVEILYAGVEDPPTYTCGCGG